VILIIFHVSYSKQYQPFYDATRNQIMSSTEYKACVLTIRSAQLFYSNFLSHLTHL